MQLTIKIKMDNEAFRDNPGAEVWRILSDTDNRGFFDTLAPEDNIALRDYNGNVCGSVEVTE